MRCVHFQRFRRLVGATIRDARLPLCTDRRFRRRTDRSDMDCRVYHSVMERTGELTTSNPLLNRLHENAVWSMRSNFVSIPTDCPQRDERMGWTGDICLFVPTAAYLYDVYGFLKSWLKDVRADQVKWGTVPFYVRSCRWAYGRIHKPSPRGRFGGGSGRGRCTWKAGTCRCSPIPTI